MKRTIIAAAAAAAFLAVGVGTANAAVLNGKPSGSVLIGTPGSDVLNGRGQDYLNGGSGFDIYNLSPYGSTVYAVDGQRDIINCRGGADLIYADKVDVLNHCSNATVVIVP